MATQLMTPGQEKYWKSFIEDALSKVHAEIGLDSSKIQNLIERHDEFQAYVVAGIKQFVIKK